MRLSDINKLKKIIDRLGIRKNVSQQKDSQSQAQSIPVDDGGEDDLSDTNLGDEAIRNKEIIDMGTTGARANFQDIRKPPNIANIL